VDFIPMTYKEDELLQGAIDLHVHPYPDIMPGRLEDYPHVRAAAAAGMAAMVFKPSFWPTMGVAQLLDKLVPDFRVFGGITLDINNGGLQPWAVEAAAELGAKIVWMPTWSSQGDLTRKSFQRRFPTLASLMDKFPPTPVSILDEQGRLLPPVFEILEIVRKHDVALSTGHLQVPESRVLLTEAAKMGLKKLIFLHPVSQSVRGTLADMQEMVALGAYVEHTFVTAFPFFQRLDTKLVLQSIEVLGAGKVLLSSDAFSPHNPPVPEMIRLLIALLLEQGIGEAAIRTMLHENPRIILNME